MIDETSSIQTQYGSEVLIDRIMVALRTAGHETDNPTVEMLNSIDQLHAGGLSSTKALAHQVGITRDMKLLDAGCGVGGSSRYLASEYGCRIEAIDLAGQCVEVATRLNKLCGLDDQVCVRQGSVNALPYKNQSFDLVWCQSVAMNIEDKPGMFAEVSRVLTPGGHFMFSHAAQGPFGEPYYPLPWAMDSGYSFLSTPEEILRLLEGRASPIL